MLIIILCMLVQTGCTVKREFVRYPHEYIGIVEMRVKNTGMRLTEYYYSSSTKIIYLADCTPKGASVFDCIIFDEFDGDEDFKVFLMQNVGKKVKINVDVIAREGFDHEANYGTFEIIDYEVIE